MVQTLLQLTVHDILQRPLFQKAEAIATEEALARKVRWVHIMEVTQVGHLLNGNELILSTGIGWGDNEATSLSFLQQLIDHGASGLCIELGTYTKQPLERLKSLALEANFPLILFHEEVRYIDITQDLHAYFIHQHHKMVSDLEALSTGLNQLLLSGKGLQPLLNLLHETTHAQVAFFPFDAEAIFVPPLPKEDGAAFYEKWIYGEMFHFPEVKNKLAHRPILALEHLFADLLLSANQELSEFQILALDRFATAIAQEMMRTTYMEEKTRYKQDLWIADWLRGKHSLPEIRDYLMTIKPAVKLGPLLVCVFDTAPIRVEGGKSQESLLFQKQLIAGSLFEREGFHLLPTFFEQRIVFILINQMLATTAHDRILRVVHRLQKNDLTQETALFSSIFGIGITVSDPLHLPASYSSALDTVDIQKDIGLLPKPFYHELHIYKLIYLLKQTGQLTAYIDGYIGGILAYDREKNGQLLRTLHVYLTLSGSKQETAKELFIVRQTLYHRLDKIAAILGDDFMKPQKRIALELALHAFEYIHGDIH
ncbi:CdaR family transcriptional regulator [Paenibacillus pectinilyticus]|uniref:CdaR family transcriptional regulator n=1 Tax=Paenibacillus pectinilyticus TaxID=512399 RepID=A0A1C1A019_9BACL|nr:PucR family transcriptional regulator [Paenibacillus pectinilyticus]OCT13709.1 CdaR family transcriptional regulator [Paenibacillus pectinilyticus]